jgi:hypothetical protein
MDANSKLYFNTNSVFGNEVILADVLKWGVGALIAMPKASFIVVLYSVEEDWKKNTI